MNVGIRNFDQRPARFFSAELGFRCQVGLGGEFRRDDVERDLALFIFSGQREGNGDRRDFPNVRSFEPDLPGDILRVALA